MIVAAAIVGCGKNEDGRPQSDAKAPSPTTSTNPEPQAKPKESTEEEIPLSEYDKEPSGYKYASQTIKNDNGQRRAI